MKEFSKTLYKVVKTSIDKNKTIKNNSAPKREKKESIVKTIFRNKVFTNILVCISVIIGVVVIPYAIGYIAQTIFGVKPEVSWLVGLLIITITILVIMVLWGLYKAVDSIRD